MRKGTHTIITLIVSLLMIGIVSACTVQESSDPTPTTEAAATEDAQTYDGKKVVFVNSYHEGYVWSDNIEAGFSKTLENTDIEVTFIRLDTRLNTDEAFRETAAADAYATIQEINPDVVVACDDNAQQYLIVPYLLETETPVVFCGVNSDVSTYGYPTDYVTGMAEVDLVNVLFDHMQKFTDGKKVAFVTEDVATEDRVIEVYNQDFFDGEMEAFKATDYEGFKEAFLQAQDAADIVLIGNNAGMSDWDEEDASIFFTENVKIPTGSLNPWIAPYVLIVVGKSAEEQGEWAATATLQILDGTMPGDIEIVKNKRGDLTVNLEIAEKLNVELPVEILRHAEVYQPEESE